MLGQPVNTHISNHSFKTLLFLSAFFQTPIFVQRIPLLKAQIVFLLSVFSSYIAIGDQISRYSAI